MARCGRGRIGAALGIATAVGVAWGGCSPAPATVTARRLAALPAGEIQRIAIAPFAASGRLGEPRAGAAAPQAAGETPAASVAHVLAEAMRRLPTWQIVDPAVTDEAMRGLYGAVRAPSRVEAGALGARLGVDAVLRGEVEEFVERVGTEVAAQRPARVAFAVELVRVPSAEALWLGRYAEGQQALTDNLWNLAGFLRTGVRWVRARELAEVGAERVAGQLHLALYGVPVTPARRPAQPALGGGRSR